MERRGARKGLVQRQWRGSAKGGNVGVARRGDAEAAPMAANHSKEVLLLLRQENPEGRSWDMDEKDPNIQALVQRPWQGTQVIRV